MSADHLAIDVAGDINVTAPDLAALTSAALFAGNGVEVIEPLHLRQDIMESLIRVRDLHSEACS
jgi:predicted DNA-binding transcriptional regulator YafY